MKVSGHAARSAAFYLLPFLRRRIFLAAFPGRVKSAISCTLALVRRLPHSLRTALQPGNLFISSGIAMCDKLYTHTLASARSRKVTHAHDDV
jgi:hypothetical protein